MHAPPALTETEHADARVEFEAFFRRYHRDLARLAYTMTGNREDANDVIGETFASVWQHWDRVRAADHPIGYVRKIIVNLSADRVRRAIRERQGTALLGPMTRWFHHGPDVGAAVDLQAAVLTLPPGRRACVVLRHVFDLSEDDVARTLGISLGTVKSQTSKGLAQLRKALTVTDPAGDRQSPLPVPSTLHTRHARAAAGQPLRGGAR